MVAQAYLDAVEGPLWVAVRGTGLAYGTGFSRSTDVGLLTLRIYRSPDTYKAYLAAKDEVEGYATGKTPFDKFALEGAVSSIVMGFADEQPTMGSAANLSFVNQVIRGIGKDWNDGMLEKVRQIKEEEIRDVLQRLIMPIFRPESTNLVVTCATIMEEVSAYSDLLLPLALEYVLWRRRVPYASLHNPRPYPSTNFPTSPPPNPKIDSTNT